MNTELLRAGAGFQPEMQEAFVAGLQMGMALADKTVGYKPGVHAFVKGEALDGDDDTVSIGESGRMEYALAALGWYAENCKLGKVTFIWERD